MKQDSEVLTVEHLTPTYGNRFALRDVSLSLHRGEVLAIVGDNGAGKSSLLKILSGLVNPASGTVYLRGEQVSYSTITDAQRLGIYTLFQTPSTCHNMSIADNIFLGHELLNCGFIDKRAMRSEASVLLQELGSTLAPSRPVNELSDGERKTVLFARTLLMKAPVLLLDEPTASLSALQTAEVLSQIEKLKELGTAIMYIDHDLNNVFAIADRICVLRHGAVASILPTHQSTYRDVLTTMAGIA